MTINGLFETFLFLRPALQRYLEARGAGLQEAEDVLQEVGVKAASEIAHVAQTKAYLYRTAHNIFLLHRRTALRRAVREEAWFQVNTGDPPEIDESPCMESRLIAREQLAIVQAIIDRMPERTRLIFRMFRIEGMAHRDIAEKVGISRSAVEKHLARAYDALAREKRNFDEVNIRDRSLKGRGGGGD